MEKVCKNCEYFTQVSISTDRYSWGDCMKPVSCLVEINGEKEHGAFMWANKTCCDFRSKQKPRQGSQIGD